MSKPHRMRVASVSLANPLAALRALADLPHAFVLHSSLSRADARWCFFGADPFLVSRGDEADARLHWSRFSRVSPQAVPAEATEPPFIGGMVGYWAYDFGRRLERLPARAADDLRLPDFVAGFYDVVGVFDKATGRAWLFSSGLPKSGDRQAERAERRLAFFAERFEGAAATPAVPAVTATRAPAGAIAGRDASAARAAHSTFTPDDFKRTIESVVEHIRRGDIFQANLSQRWTLPLEKGERGQAALALAEALARRSPSPYAAYFDAGDHAVVSASPERFLQLTGRDVETRPIKGTRPRGEDRVEDLRLAAELKASAKDRAENVMIVDVLRNDLGRVCETGTVKTPALCVLESFPQVHHLVSTVTGTLRENVDAFDLLHACFPGGSITGAPKIRAMEIIDALEPVRRHIYTGAVGYVGWNGNADWNIAIRTATLTPDTVHFSAGGGITADSDPDAEFEETLHKAEGMRLALGDVFGPVALAGRLAPVGR